MITERHNTHVSVTQGKRGHGLGAALAVGAMVLGLLAPGGRHAWAQGSRGDRPVTLTLADTTFDIPPAYFLGRIPETARPQELRLDAVLPALEPLSSDDESAFLTAPGWGRVVEIRAVAMAPTATPTATLAAALAADQAALEESRAAQDGLAVPMPGAGSTVDPRSDRRDLTLDRTGDGLRAYLLCDASSGAHAPGCTHVFVHRGLLVRLAYDKGDLPHRQAIEDAAVRLLDRFERPALPAT
jgi:hypothetical protein